MSSEHTQQPQHNTRAGQDAEADRNASNANAHGIVTVDIEGLGRPEHEDGKEVGAGDEGDDESEDERPRRLLDASRKHGILGKLHLPDHKRSQQDHTNDEGSENMSRFPRILPSSLAMSPSLFLPAILMTNLITTPLHSAHED